MAGITDEYIASQRERGRESTAHELEQKLEEQKYFWARVNQSKTEHDIGSGMVAAERSYLDATERYDLATLKNGIHPVDAAFREGQRDGIKDFEVKHGLVEAAKPENLTDAITEKLRNAESNIEKHWIQHPYGHEEYYRGVADSVNSLHSLLEKHAPELAQNLPPKIDLHQIAERVEQSIHQKQSESISIGAF